MRVSRFLTAAGLALALAVTMSVTSLAQAKTDEDYDKLMKAVGAANGAMRGAAKETERRRRVGRSRQDGGAVQGRAGVLDARATTPKPPNGRARR